MNAAAEPPTPPTSLAVAGADHPHLFEIVERLARSGVRTAAHTPAGALARRYGRWRDEAGDPSREATLDEILADDTIGIVVTAGIPSERAATAVAAIEAGKYVVSDKPGVTTAPQLEAVRAAIGGRRGRPWTVLFTERFENRAINEAVRLARAGAVGRVVHVVGAGPHTLWADRRPDWFWEPTATGGILVDIGSHQVDQFLAVTGAGASDVAVVASAVGNVASPEHPAMEDIGSMTLVAAGAGAGAGAGTGGIVGDHRLDYLTAAGLGTWGDVRLTIVGTEGTLEARANVDPAGEPGGEHLIVVDGDGTRRVDLAEVTVDWADTLLADLVDGSERLMSQQHVIDVTEVCLRAQAAAARRWQVTGSSS